MSRILHLADNLLTSGFHVLPSQGSREDGIQHLSDSFAVRVTDILEMRSSPSPTRSLSVQPSTECGPKQLLAHRWSWTGKRFAVASSCFLRPPSLPSNSSHKTLEPTFPLARSSGHTDFRSPLRHEVCNKNSWLSPSHHSGPCFSCHAPGGQLNPGCSGQRTLYFPSLLFSSLNPIP